MPALSPTMEEGKLAKWLVKEGQTIKPGDIIAEIETDKATMEVEAVDEGKVSKLLISEGTEGVKVNTPIAVLLAEGEKDGAPTVAKQPSPAATKGQAPRAPAAASRSSPSPSCRRRVFDTTWGGVRGGGTTSRRVSPLPSPPPPGGRGSRGVERGTQRPRPHHRLAAGATAGEGGGTRSGGAHRQRAAWAHRQARYRRRPRGRRGAAQGGHRRRKSVEPGGDGTRRTAHARRQDPGALREGLLRGPAPRRHAQGHRPAPDHVASRPSRTSISRSIAASTSCCAPASA